MIVEEIVIYRDKNVNITLAIPIDDDSSSLSPSQLHLKNLYSKV